ncbi:hypothetical protein FSARC_10457 [Fusarium sarcochroum]|uniref:BTB domain-containing protein n=1 Tax=Fusarium sarcochroum TaxID=1208366 RepID=A0A8H4TMK2_9HYPO|nr:hypothetical protein FSARC_10457 [Fusarium sarcochroum]
MESPRDAKVSTVVQIAADGDLLLIVGPEETRIRVHSTSLMAASKPFSVMLGPHWKEGQNKHDHDEHDREKPFELLLPDDNAVALKMICFILHHQNREVPRSLTARDILAIAVAADKYDCLDALRFASESWLRTSGDEAGNLMLLTAAAYIFQDAQAFKEITRALIIYYDGSYLALSLEEVESFMPWRVFCKSRNDRLNI